MPEEKIASQPRRSKVSRYLQLIASLGLVFAALFGGAGTWNWLRGWIYLAAYLILMAGASVVVRRTNPDLFEARANWRRRDTKRFDKFFLAVFLPLTYAMPAIASLDNMRFGWWPIPFVAVYPGLLLLALSIALITWVMAVNRFAESTVRIQTDRGHTVVTTGPYRFVRHPMYVGACLMFLATPLILGSMWAMAFSLVLAILFIARTALEDRTLRRELAGYEAYAARTRYRLVPGVW